MESWITSTIESLGYFGVVVLMFLGRLGPVTVATATAYRHRRLLYELPEERPLIG